MEVQTFPKGINLKVNSRVRREIEVTYYNTEVQNVNHYTPGSHL